MSFYKYLFTPRMFKDYNDGSSITVITNMQQLFSKYMRNIEYLISCSVFYFQSVYSEVGFEKLGGSFLSFVSVF